MDKKKKAKISRVFMLIFGIILLIAGIIVVVASTNLTETLKEHFAFFLSGGILVYLGLTWKKDKE